MQKYNIGVKKYTQMLKELVPIKNFGAASVLTTKALATSAENEFLLQWPVYVMSSKLISN